MALRFEEAATAALRCRMITAHLDLTAREMA